MNPSSDLPRPRDVLGFDVGRDRKLADWKQISDYMAQMAQSPNMTWEEIGRTTEDRPFYLATISSAGNLENLEQLRQVQKRLADPRTLDPAELPGLIQRGRSVVLLTCSMHSTEIGSSQMSMELVHQLLTEPRFEPVLEDVVLLLVPCLNPDGLDLMVDWYRETVGGAYEGTQPPWLYHKYTGHDNNRDWFMLTQKENRLLVAEVHNRWHPHIVFDQHQTEPSGPRYVLPPYIDPINPHIDPLLQASANSLGLHMAHEMTDQGFRGVAVHTSYACYSPAIAYQHFHGGTRILSEAASCRVASPVEIAPEEMKGRRGFQPRSRSWNNPWPWPGGTWSLRDIVDYHKTAAISCLEHASRNRLLWVRGFANIMKRAVEPSAEKPAGYLVSLDQPGPTSAQEMLAVLARGCVEVHRLESAAEVSGQVFPPGSYWIPSSQPFESFARVLLSEDPYPVPPGASTPHNPPLDTTGHNLSRLTGVEVLTVGGREAGATGAGREKWELTPPLTLGEIESPSPVATGASQGLLLPGAFHRSWEVVNSRLAEGEPAYRLGGDSPDGSARRGDFFLPGARAWKLPPGLPGRALTGHPEGDWQPVRRPRVGMYKSFYAPSDEGWTRWVLEEYGFEYQSLVDADIRSGQIGDLDIIILPHQEQTQWYRIDRDVPPSTGEPFLTRDGLLPGSYPPEFTGGLGRTGARALAEFVEAGGVILALGESSTYLAHDLHLEARDALAEVPKSEFSAPGTLVWVTVAEDKHPLAWGLGRVLPGLIAGGPVMEAGTGRDILRFAPRKVLADGFLRGEDYLAGRPAVSEFPLGRGFCVLSHLRLQYRAQARATYPVLFNALAYAAMEQGR